MIKKERGALTYLSQEINNLTRDDVIAGIHLVNRMEEKMQQKLNGRYDMER